MSCHEEILNFYCLSSPNFKFFPLLSQLFRCKKLFTIGGPKRIIHVTEPAKPLGALHLCVSWRVFFLCQFLRMSNMPETKSFCTYEQQLQILKRRGLSIADDALALQWLRGKELLSPECLFLTLRHKSPSTGEDEFLKDSSFSTIIDLYQFDEQFRAAISHAAAIAETNLKAYIAYYHARQYGPVGYLDGNHFEDPWRHAKLLNGLSKSLGLRKDEPFVLHHHKDLNDVYPVWVIVEVLTFDQVSMMYRNLLPEDRAAIAREFYGISSREYIENWTHCAVVARNIAAHGSRF